MQMKYSTRRLEEIDGVNKYQAARYLYDFLRENDLVQLKKHLNQFTLQLNTQYQVATWPLYHLKKAST